MNVEWLMLTVMSMTNSSEQHKVKTIIEQEMMLYNKPNVKDCYPASFLFLFIYIVQPLLLPLQIKTRKKNENHI